MAAIEHRRRWSKAHVALVLKSLYGRRSSDEARRKPFEQDVCPFACNLEPLVDVRRTVVTPFDRRVLGVIKHDVDDLTVEPADIVMIAPGDT